MRTASADSGRPLLGLDEAVAGEAAGVAGGADGAARGRRLLVHLGRQAGHVRDVGTAGRLRRQTLVHQTPELGPKTGHRSGGSHTDAGQ